MKYFKILWIKVFAFFPKWNICTTDINLIFLYMKQPPQHTELNIKLKYPSLPLLELNF